MKTDRLPRVVWLLGLVSLCMDLSSEMIHGYLPVFIRDVLGASILTVGVIEGIGEGTASISKVFSGMLSDRFERRKPLVVVGYGLAALSKPFFPLAKSAEWVLFAKLADRIGKGIRGAPRDALIADVTAPEVRGAAYGLRQAMDTAGAVLGPLVGIGLMIVLAGNIRAVFWIAALPALVAVSALIYGIDEPPRHFEKRDKAVLPTWREMHSLGSSFWIVVAIGAVFTLARFSEAFLIVRAYDMGLSLSWTPLALVVMNVTYVATAYPVGRLSDRIGRTGLLAIGLAVLIAADAILAKAMSLNLVLLGVAVWGLHLGLTQGLLSALVADTVPADLRGSAFGVFYFMSGVAAIAASVLAGLVWKLHGPAATFYIGAMLSVLALASLILWWLFQLRGREHGTDH